MLILLEPHIQRTSQTFEALLRYVAQLANIEYQLVDKAGQLSLRLLGETNNLALDLFESMPGVAQVNREHSPYRLLGTKAPGTYGFDYQGLHFSQSNLHCMVGLCAVDTPNHVEAVMRQLQSLGQTCTRMGAYKPRTSPYTFQGHGKSCLPYVFELAGKYGIRVIAMEVLEPAHISEINVALAMTGYPTGVMLQIGTRNCQNYSLLEAVGAQNRYPVLLKRGFGLSLHEALMAAEYIAHAGNPNIIFCLRGVKTIAAEPHRNLADFAQVPTVKRLTRMPVCVDPSHAIGCVAEGADRLSDIQQAAAQGVIAGANLVLADCHPSPSEAWVDGHQALSLRALGPFIEDMLLVHETYRKRCTLAEEAIDA